MTARELDPVDRVAQYALLVRLVAAALALLAAGPQDAGYVSLLASSVVIVAGNYVALRHWPYVVDVLRVHDKPLYLVLDVALALSTIAVVGTGSPLVLYLAGTASLAGLVYSWRLALGCSIAMTAGYLTVLLARVGDLPGGTDVHTVFTLPALILGAGPAAAAVRRLLGALDADARAVTALQSAIAVREERLRLSREVHDSITKNLHGVALLAGGLIRAVDRDRDTARSTAELIATTARELAEESRAVILDLREPGEAPFAAALTDAVQGGVAGHDLLVEVTTGPDGATVADDLSGSARHALLAAIGEAVHNVVKHAGAQHLRVACDTEAGDLLVTVSDDGVGLGASKIGSAPGHLGLAGMRERLAGLGGSVELAASPDGGTRVSFRVPRAAANLPEPLRVVPLRPTTLEVSRG